MEAPAALNITPLNAPHNDLNWLPLADKDFQIKELFGDQNYLQSFFQVKDSHLNNSDILGIWESNLPIYFLPYVYVFPEIIHQCCAKYVPIHRAVMSPTKTMIFYITAKSINEMLHFKPT